MYVQLTKLRRLAYEFVSTLLLTREVPGCSALSERRNGAILLSLLIVVCHPRT